MRNVEDVMPLDPVRPPAASESAEVLARRTLDLVRIPSPSGAEEQVADHVERFLRETARPTSLRRYPRAAVATFGWTPGPGAEDLHLLVGHLDTVPERGHPVPTCRQGEVVGLGACDMKGGLAVMMTVAERAGHATAGHRPFALVFYDAEEGPLEKNGLGRLLASEPWLTKAGLALLLEPTDNVLELGCQGSLHARVTFIGLAAHSARPWMGENAVHRGSGFLSRVARIPPRRYVDGPAEYLEVIGVTLAEGGSSRNVLPDRFTLNVNLRFAPDRSPEGAEQYLRSLVPSGAQVEILDLAPAAPPRTDAPFLARLLEETGLPVRGKQAWTDVAQFAARGVPAVNFGPGDPALAHRKDEKVAAESLVRCCDVLTRVLDIR